MKKIKIYKQINVGGIRYKEAVECEKVIDDNLAIYVIKSPREAVIIDIKTGLAVSRGMSKKDAIENFKMFHSRIYYDYIETIAYQKAIEAFDQLEEYHPEVTFDDTESELDNED